MRAVTPGGKGHWILDTLAADGRSRDDLLAEADLAGRAARKMPYVIAALQRSGLVVHRNGLYAITTAGEAELTRLNAAARLYKPGARVFVQGAAA